MKCCREPSNAVPQNSWVVSGGDEMRTWWKTRLPSGGQKENSGPHRERVTTPCRPGKRRSRQPWHRASSWKNTRLRICEHLTLEIYQFDKMSKNHCNTLPLWRSRL